MQPLVSIITPCYNSEKYINRYLDCILKQTYSNIQLIIINDGSSDSTEKIVAEKESELKEKGIYLTYQYQANKGLGGAINAGLKLIQGEYFTWCDSDNLLTSDYIETKVNYFKEHPEAAIVRCDGYNVYDSDINNPISKMSDGNTEIYRKDLFYNCLTCKNFHFGCTMLKTEEFDKINPKREIYPSREGQNWQIMLPMLYHYESHYIDRPMFYFVIRDDSISHIAATKGLDAMIAQNNECEKIETITVKSMSIPEEKDCIDIIKKQYAYIRFWLADKYENIELLKKEFYDIKNNGWLNEEIKLSYKRWSNPVWRFMHSLKNLK